MATKAGEIELDVRLTGDDISKTLHKISDSITKKFDSAFSSLSKDFENVSTETVLFKGFGGRFSENRERVFKHQRQR